jgi:hypothetical protein
MMNSGHFAFFGKFEMKTPKRTWIWVPGVPCFYATHHSSLWSAAQRPGRAVTAGGLRVPGETVQTTTICTNEIETRRQTSINLVKVFNHPQQKKLTQTQTQSSPRHPK